MKTKKLTTGSSHPNSVHILPKDRLKGVRLDFSRYTKSEGDDDPAALAASAATAFDDLTLLRVLRLELAMKRGALGGESLGFIASLLAATFSYLRQLDPNERATVEALAEKIGCETSLILVDDTPASRAQA